VTPAAERYLREPPALHPAVVGCLYRRGRVGPAEVIASVLLQVAQGALTVRDSTRRVTTIAGAEEVPVVELRVAEGRWDALDPLDRELLSALFALTGTPGALTIADLQAATRRRSVKAALARWRARVRARAEELGLLRGRRRTAAGREAHARHEAFRRYLRDFGTLDDEPPLAVTLWGEYLAYATLFGLGDRVARELDLGGPGAAAHPDRAVWKAWLGLRR
jgi:hypothetical protein